MTDEINVHVVEYKDRKNLMMRYEDPVTRQHVARSTRTTNKREAERIAAKWEAELREGRYNRSGGELWEDFRDKYEDLMARELASNTLEKIASVFNTVEQIIRPVRVRDFTEQRLVLIKQELLRKGRRPDTVASIFAHLRSALNTAVEWGILQAVPRFPKIKRVKGDKMMRGRPITTEEFERMLAAVPKVVPEHAVESWRYLLNGLWLSGLRLGEACELYWDGRIGHCIDTCGKRPMFRIRGELEKGKRNRLLPMTPDFWQFLKRTPPGQRKGRVFVPAAKQPGRPTPLRHRVGEVIAAIGEAAGVIVDFDPRTGDPTKFASAHDLRRAFGERWARRVHTPELQQLMRHQSIHTTMKYYAALQAEETADSLWRNYEAEEQPTVRRRRRQKV